MGNDATDIEGCMKIMDKTIYGNTSIKSAFDIALHDIAAQNAGLPIYKFLGGEMNKVLETDMTISIGDPEKMKADAIRFKAEGFPAIKVKLSGDVAADFKRITYIREGIGMETPLQLDANQGWEEASRALEILTMLKDFNIRFCEEPILRSNYMELPQLKKASPIPIMADECCGDHVDAKRLIDLDACHMFNIKLGKSSGFFKGKKIAELGAAHQMQMQVGGFMESKLGMTAAAHLALHNEYIRYCDFDTPLMFTEDPVVGGIEYRENGVIEVPETPGLGAVIDSSYLAKAEKFIFN
jgi:L-alanine-DL-glutamate epimerase-like enolase superfamily enzyme